jgi:hypothetical protein
MIMTTLHKNVNQWNDYIQSKNPNREEHLPSSDKFSEVDDPHGILAKILNKEVLNNVSEYNI